MAKPPPGRNRARSAGIDRAGSAYQCMAEADARNANVPGAKGGRSPSAASLVAPGMAAWCEHSRREVEGHIGAAGVARSSSRVKRPLPAPISSTGPASVAGHRAASRAATWRCTRAAAS